MNQLNSRLTWAIISLQGVMLIIDPEARNHIYHTFAAFNSVSLPLLQQLSQHLRYIISFALIPTLFYGQSWIIPKFISLVAYVFFICLHSNLLFFNQLTDIKFLLISLLILGKALLLLVDDMLEQQRKSRILLRKKSSIQVEQKDSSVSPQKPIQPLPKVKQSEGPKKKKSN